MIYDLKKALLSVRGRLFPSQMSQLGSSTETFLMEEA